MTIHIPYFHPKLPLALKVAKDQLTDARRDVLLYAKQAEYYAAMEAMCRARVARLDNEIQALEEVPVTPSPPIQLTALKQVV